MSARILIITNSSDLHADLVIDRLHSRGTEPFRLNLDEFPARYALDLGFSHGQWSGTLGHAGSGNPLPIDRIGAVWTRKTADFLLPEGLVAQEVAFARQEAEQILSGLLHSLDCYWMSHPSAVRRALWKCEQLKRAARHGFRVPRSAVTSNPDSVLGLRKDLGKIVFKALSSPHLGAEKVDRSDLSATGLATTIIDAEHDGLLDSVNEFPCFFQEYIPKSYELRVTVVDTRVFAAKIHSQEFERTRVDYRDFEVPVRYEATTLPEKIEGMCIDFVRSYGLNYGAIDLIVSNDDEYYFLENNPVGQFLFIEQLAPDLQLTSAVADRLLDAASSWSDS